MEFNEYYKLRGLSRYQRIINWFKGLFTYSRDKNHYVIRSLVKDKDSKATIDIIRKHHTNELRKAWCHEIIHEDLQRHEMYPGYILRSQGYR